MVKEQNHDSNWTSKCCLPANTGLGGSFLTIQGPTILGILGPNGAGKSTLIKAMLGLLPHSGKVQLDQKRSRPSSSTSGLRRTEIRYWFPLPITVRECVSLGLYPHLSIFKRKSKRISKSGNALKLVNLLDLADRQIGQLSGGQFQRVLIARCLVKKQMSFFGWALCWDWLSLAKTSSCRHSRPWKRRQDHSDRPSRPQQGSSLLWPGPPPSSQTDCFWENRGNLYQRKSACSLWAWTLYRRWRRMITEFIDGLQQFHFLQNALITAIAIGIVAGAVGCFIILRACLSWEMLSHTQFFLVWLCPLSWASISLLAPLPLAPGFRPHHLYQEQLHHQERHCNWDYLFFFPRLRSHPDRSR